MTGETDNRLAIVLKGYPRLSETFIAQEILELERAGLNLEIISLRKPTDKHTHPVHDEISARVLYLPEYLHHEPLRVLASLARAVWAPGFLRACRTFAKDFRRDFTINRIRRFGQAAVLANERRGQVELLYAHFLHTPGSVARYAAMLMETPYSLSAHAKDIWTTPDWEIEEKLAECEWCVTCTKGGREHLAQLAPDDGTVKLVYHGIDLTRFPAAASNKKPPADGSSSNNSLHLLTVGRAVEKKGIDTLLEALARLPKDLHWRWSHIGGGPLKGRLEVLATKLGIAERCEFLGALPQATVLETYRKSDLFILPSRIDSTGDRDGLPNVIIEAQSQRLAVISTNISGIPELLSDGKNGILVEPDSPQNLANAIKKLCRDAGLREKMGTAGNARVRAGFNHKRTIGSIVTLLTGSLDKAGK